MCDKKCWFKHWTFWLVFSDLIPNASEQSQILYVLCYILDRFSVDSLAQLTHRSERPIDMYTIQPGGSTFHILGN